MKNKNVRINLTNVRLGFPDGTVVKCPPANAGDTGDMDSIPGSGISSGPTASLFLPGRKETCNSLNQLSLTSKHFLSL